MARQPMEDREYEVSAAQLRWRLAQLNAAGVPIQGYQQGQGNVYIITVQQPSQAPPLDWQTIALGVLVLAGAALYLAWTVATGAGWRPPWQAMPNGEPVVTQTEPQGWTLPNPFQPAQEAAQATQEAANAVSDAVAMLVRVVLVLVALAGLWLLRGLLGPLARGAAQLAQDVAGRMRR
jgi:predicted DNA-binding transcriptional regulator YafY